MQINELIKLTDWFQAKVVAKGIPANFQALFNKMNANIRRNLNQPMQPFSTERDALFEAIRPINFQSLSLEQINFLKELEIDELFGPIGVDRIEGILYKNNLDLAAATRIISELNTKLTTAQTKLKQIEDSLKPHFSFNQDEFGEGNVMMRIYFKDDSSINNLSDLKKLGSTWYDIGRGIAMTQGKSPEDFVVVGAQKGSIILELAVAAGIATSVSKILLETLKVAEKVIDILKKVEELKALSLSNKSAEQALVKVAKEEKETGISSITNIIQVELNLNPETDGDKITALEKSITKLIDFTQKGGQVDFVQPEEKEEDENGDDDINYRGEIQKLKGNIAEIRAIENKTKLLINNDKLA
jgi:hypothetical protein